MTRVDENRDAQRAEERRTAEKLDQKRSQKQAEQFSKLMGAGRQQATEEQRRQASSQGSAARTRNRQAKQAGARLAAHSALLAKQGIQSNLFADKLQREGKARLEQGYEDRATRKHELSEDRQVRHAEQATKKEEEAQVRRQADKLAPISRDDRSNNRGDGFSGRGEGENRAQNAPDVALGGQGRGDGVGAAAGPQGASAAQQAHGASSTPAQMQQMIGEIVKYVMTGVDAKGLGVMHITLREHVLSGAQLTMKADKDGVSLRIRTHDDNVVRLLSSGQTVHELQQALQAKDLQLTALEVNDDKVVRS